MRLILLLLFAAFSSGMYAQKMLLLERANRAKTTKYYVGETLRYRLAGKENYWYERSITDILPESKTLLLDNFPVKLDSISQIKVRRKGYVRLIGGTLFAFGGSLAFATTVGLLYRDKSVDPVKLYGTSVVSMGIGWLMNTPRKLKLGKKFRLRIIEIKFPDPLIPPPPLPKH